MTLLEATVEDRRGWIGNPGHLAALGVSFRVFDEEDRNYIIHSYMQSYWKHGIRETGRNGGMPVGLMDHEAYSVYQRAILLGLLAAGEVIIACSARDPWFVFGYLVGEVREGSAPVVHYVVVKEKYRRKGVAAGLIGELLKRAGDVDRLVFSHWTATGGPKLVAWLKRQGLQPVWNPYLAR